MLLIQLMLALFLSPQAAEGALTVVSEPAARVVWDGVELGRTDSRGQIRISGIPLGSYRVLVSKEGFEPSRRRIEVDAGHSVLHFDLKALPPPMAPLAATAPEPRATAASVSEPPRTAAAIALDLPRVRAREVRASQITEAERFDVSWLWFLPLAGLLAGVLFWLGRVQRAAPAVAAGANFSDPEFPGPPDFARDAARAGSSSVSFLDDLRRREAMADRGVAVPRGVDMEGAIDLGEDDVRSLEEPQNSSGSGSGEGDGS